MRKKLILELTALNEILSEICDREDNIHEHTQIIGQFYQRFYAVDIENNFSSNNESLEVIIKEILAECPESKRANVTWVLNKIKATTLADTETGVNVQQLLTRTWSLCTTHYLYSNAIAELIKNLDHNILAEGGCVPGIAARLIQPYAAFVLKMLKNLTPETDHRRDEALESALAISALEHENKETDEEQRQIELATIVSISASAAQRENQGADEEFQRQLEFAKAISMSGEEEHKTTAEEILSLDADIETALRLSEREEADKVLDRQALQLTLYNSVLQGSNTDSKQKEEDEEIRLAMTRSLSSGQK